MFDTIKGATLTKSQSKKATDSLRERDTLGSDLTVKQTMELMEKALKFGYTIQTLRSVRKAVSETRDPKWMPTFYEQGGHKLLFRIFQNEVNTAKPVSNKTLGRMGLNERVKDNENLAECCRAARVVINNEGGLNACLQVVPNTLQLFCFSLRYVNVVTQSLVLTALAAVCIVSPYGHLQLCNYYRETVNCATLKVIFKSSDPELLHNAFQLVNSMINQFDYANHRDNIRDILLAHCSLRKCVRRTEARNYFEHSGLKTQVITFNEAQLEDLDADSSGPPWPSLESLRPTLFANATPDPTLSPAPVRTGPAPLRPATGPGMGTITPNHPSSPSFSSAAIKLQLTKKEQEALETAQKIEELELRCKQLELKLKASEDEVKTLRAGQELIAMERISSAKEAAQRAKLNPPPSPLEPLDPASRASIPEWMDPPTVPGASEPMKRGGPPPPSGRGGPPPPPTARGGPPPPPTARGGPPPPPGSRGAPNPPGAGRGAPPPPGGAPGPPPAPSVTQKVKYSPNLKMKNFNWTKLPKVAGTVWENLNDETIIPKMNLVQFEEMFQIQDKAVTEEKETEIKPIKVQLLAPKRSNHIRLKLSVDMIYNAIRSLDFNAWTATQIQQIKTTLPTKEEKEILKSYNGDFEMLGNAEKFLIKIMELPQLNDLMTSVACKASFADKFEDISVDILTALGASQAMLENTHLPKFLEFALAFGNYMNGQSARGGFYGFKIQSLIKYSETMSTKEPKKSLLHYMVEVIQKSEDSSIRKLSDLSNGLDLVHKAHKVIIPEVQEKLKELKYEVAIVAKLLQDDSTDPNAVRIFGPFYTSASLQIKNVEDKLAELTKKNSDMIKYFGEPASTPSYSFFQTWSVFLHKFDDALDDLDKWNKEALLAEHKKKKEGVQGFTKSDKPTVTNPQQGLKLEQGTLDFALANLKSRGNAFNRRVTLTAEQSVDAAEAIANIRKNLNYVSKPPPPAKPQSEDDGEPINPFLAAKKMEAQALEQQKNSSTIPPPAGGRGIAIPGMVRPTSPRPDRAGGTLQETVVLKSPKNVHPNQEAISNEPAQPPFAVALKPVEPRSPEPPKTSGLEASRPTGTVAPRTAPNFAARGRGIPLPGVGAVGAVPRGGRGLSSNDPTLMKAQSQPILPKKTVNTQPQLPQLPHQPQLPPQPQTPQQMSSKGKGFRPPTDAEAWATHGLDDLSYLPDEIYIDGVHGPVDLNDLDNILSDF